MKNVIEVIVLSLALIATLLFGVMSTGCEYTSKPCNITVMNVNGDAIKEYNNVTYRRIDTETYLILNPDGSSILISGGIVEIKDADKESD